MCIQLGWFHRGRPVWTQIFTFYLPINHSWRQKTRDTELPDGEDRIHLRSIVLTQYQSLKDEQTDGFAVAHVRTERLCDGVCADAVV